MNGSWEDSHEVSKGHLQSGGVISVRAQTTPNVIFFAKLLYSNHKINSRALK
jgi:hypothetical protein